MRSGGTMVGSIVFGLALIGIAALCLRIYLGREAESRLRPAEVIDFSARNSVGRDNVFAVCPPNFCAPPADRDSPVFAMRWERLRGYWQEVVAAQKSVEQVAVDASARRFTYIQRSAVLRFPDIVTVEFVALGDDRSTLAIDSRSRYGSSDLGVNRRRVSEWMDLLEHMIRRGQHPTTTPSKP